MSPEVIASLDAIKVNMNAAGMNAINIVLAFVMFGVALGIKPRSFVGILTNPKSLILGIICQLVLLPALTFLLCITFDGWISPMIALGISALTQNSAILATKVYETCEGSISLVLDYADSL